MFRSRWLGRTAPLIAVLFLAPALWGANFSYALITPAAAPAAPDFAPMDLVGAAADPNGLPLNPSWRYQIERGAPPDADALCASANTPCTTQQPTFDKPVGWDMAVCMAERPRGGAFDSLAGHANWFPVTYTGTVTWGHWVQEDGDDALELVPPNTPGTQNIAGATKARTTSLHSEFNDDETLALFTSPWWRNFQTIKQQGESARLSRDAARIATAKRNGWDNPGQINGKPAIIIGLAGLDCEHSCLMELHPVYAVAIQVQHSAAEDVWAIFARRSGDEGFCSSDQHPWDTDHVTFALPGPANSAPLIAAGSEFHRDSKHGTPQAVTPMVAASGAGALVTFDLGASGSGAPLVNGLLHLRWTPQSQLAQGQPAPSQPAPSQPAQAPAATGQPIRSQTVHYFSATGHAIGDMFWGYWQSHGGVAQLGYPLSEPLSEVSTLDGKRYEVQYFERAVLEAHPENAPPFQVLAAQLGTIQYRARYPAGAPGQTAHAQGGHFFDATGHWVGGAFWASWQSHGGLAQQGYPITDEFAEVSPVDGKSYTVQYFERAVFEYHPENQAPYTVLLSPLGTYQYACTHAHGPCGALH